MDRGCLNFTSGSFSFHNLSLFGFLKERSWFFFTKNSNFQPFFLMHNCLLLNWLENRRPGFSLDHKHLFGYFVHSCASRGENNAPRMGRRGRRGRRGRVVDQGDTYHSQFFISPSTHLCSTFVESTYPNAPSRARCFLSTDMEHTPQVRSSF